MTYDFYILALSQHSMRFFKCNESEAVEVKLKGTPTSVREAQKFLDEEKQWQRHTISSRAGTSPKGMAHGHAAGRDDYKLRMEEFFREVDEGVSKFLKGQKAPLVLAAVRYEAARYAKINSYAHLFGKNIDGSPDRITAKNLHARTWTLLRKDMRNDRWQPMEVWKMARPQRKKRKSNRVSALQKAGR
jgi:hypothetical protein